MRPKTLKFELNKCSELWWRGLVGYTFPVGPVRFTSVRNFPTTKATAMRDRERVGGEGGGGVFANYGVYGAEQILELFVLLPLDLN